MPVVDAEVQCPAWAGDITGDTDIYTQFEAWHSEDYYSYYAAYVLPWSLSYHWELIHFEILTERVTFHRGESLYMDSASSHRLWGAEAHKRGNKTSLKKNMKLLTLDIHAFGHDKTIITKKSLSTFIYWMKPRTRQHFQALHELLRQRLYVRTSMKRLSTACTLIIIGRNSPVITNLHTQKNVCTRLSLQCK